MDQTGIISVVAIGVSAIVSILVPIIQLWVNNKNVEKQQIYQAKREAIIQALEFLDDWLSYLTWQNGESPVETIVKDQKCNVQNMTIRARKVLNLLCVYCNYEETINLFSRILFHPEEKSADLYLKFRVSCRNELGLSIINFNENEIFIAKVSSAKLEEKE